MPDSPVTAATPDPDPPGQRFALFLGAMSALVPLGIDMYLPCFDAMAEDLGVPSERMALSLSTFFIGMFTGQLFWGPISDRFGRRRPLFVGLVMYATASVALSLCSSFDALVMLRLVQSFGGCAAMVLSRALVRDFFVGERAAHAASMVMLSQGLAPMLGPSLGAAIDGAFGWRAVFCAMALFACLLLLAGVLRVPETARGATAPLRVSTAIHHYAAVLSDPTFLRYALCGSICSSGMFAYITRSPELFLDLLHLSPRWYGICFAAGAVGIMSTGQIARVCISRRGIDGTIRLALGCQCASLVLLLVGGSARLVPAVFLPGLFFYLCSMGLLWPNISAGALQHHAHRAATGAATHGALQWGFACLVSALASIAPHGSAAPMVWLMAAAHAVGALCFLLIPRRVELEATERSRRR